MNLCKFTMKVSMSLAAATIMWSPPATAYQETPAASDGLEQPTDLTEIICRRMPPPTGSRLGARRICRTRFQWQQWDQENREFVDDLERRERMNSCIPGVGCE